MGNKKDLTDRTFGFTLVKSFLMAEKEGSNLLCSVILPNSLKVPLLWGFQAIITFLRYVKNLPESAVISGKLGFP